MPKGAKAKFSVDIDQEISRAASYTVHLTQSQVVEALDLPPEEADNWEDHAFEYIEQNWDTVAQQPNTHQTQADDEITEFSLESVEKLGEGEEE